MSMGSCSSQKSCQNPRAGDTGPCESSSVDSGNQSEILHKGSIPKPSLQPHIQDLIVLIYIEFFFLRTTKSLFFKGAWIKFTHQAVSIKIKVQYTR